MPPPSPLPTLHLVLHEAEERKLGFYIISVRTCVSKRACACMRMCVTVLVLCPRQQCRQKDELVALVSPTGPPPHKFNWLHALEEHTGNPGRY